MVAKVNSIGMFGMKSFMVEVEADISMGKARFDLVGLPDTAVSESRERVQAAIKNSGFSFPTIHVTVNLAPADVKKEGSVYDLPIFIALLIAGRQISFKHDDCAFIGELSLSGDVRPVNGVLPMVIEAKNNGIKRVFVPEYNACEGAVVEGIDVYPVKNVKQLLAFLTGKELPESERLAPAVRTEFKPGTVDYPLDFADVKGQKNVKRALEVAAAGGHNFLMIGPPGSGKSMLAKRLPTILPDMSFEESLETTKIYSIAGALKRDEGLIRTRPFRSPHHTVSAPGLSGGGTIPKPGELSLAHNGVLFLDEMPEFSRSSMEVMRQPIEDGKITISRVAGTLTFPCSVMLVCAMNPCPCGYLGHPTKKCTCSPAAAQKYLTKVSGPLLDRIDVQIEVPPVEFSALAGEGEREETSAEIKARVDAARKIQQERFKGTDINCNARMPAAMVKEYCKMDDRAKNMLKNVFDRLGLSARAYDKILKVARTVADLDGSDMITGAHIAEAIRYRNLDRKIYSNNGV